MVKAKEKTTASFGITMFSGADALTAGFEKSAAFCNTVQEYSKDTAEAYVQSAMIAGEGIQSINSELYAYSTKAASNAIDATKAAMGAKSIHELFALQSAFGKSAFEGYVAHLTRFSELFTSVGKSSFAPLETRAKAAGDFVTDAIQA